MEEQAGILLKTIDDLNATIASLSENHRKEVESLNVRIRELTAQVAYLNRQLFGRKAEKLPSLRRDSWISLQTSLPMPCGSQRKSAAKPWLR